MDKVWTGFGQALDSLWTAFAQALDRLGEGKECLGEFLSGKTVTQAQSNTVSTLEGSTDPLRPSRFVRPASSVPLRPLPLRPRPAPFPCKAKQSKAEPAKQGKAKQSARQSRERIFQIFGSNLPPTESVGGKCFRRFAEWRVRQIACAGAGAGGLPAWNVEEPHVDKILESPPLQAPRHPPLRALIPPTPPPRTMSHRL